MVGNFAFALALLIAGVCVRVDGISTLPGFPVSNFAEFKAALAAEHDVIVLTNHIDVTHTVEIAYNVTITSDGTEFYDFVGDGIIILDIVEHVDVYLSGVDFRSGSVRNHGHLDIYNCHFLQTRGNATLINFHYISSIVHAKFFNNKQGSILNFDTIGSISESYFKQNQGPVTGGICNHGGIAHITECDFEDNEGDDGGAILNYGFIGDISQSTFKRNRARYFGGAVSVVYGKITSITKSTFEGNIARIDGGALDVYRSKLRKLKGCTFEKNVARRDGGGFFTRSSKIKRIESCEFIDNNAHRHGGGAMVQKNGKVEFMSKNTFVGNWAATGIGGGIGVIWNAILYHGEHFALYDNTAHEAGGGAYFNVQAGEVLTDVVARGNDAYLEKNDVKAWSIGGAGVFIDAGSASALSGVSCLSFKGHSKAALTIHFWDTKTSINKGDKPASFHFPCIGNNTNSSF